jgi:hypothetical protein
MFGILLLVIYVLPSIAAVATNHEDKLKISFLNLFFGWTVVGWLISIIWSTNIED